MNYELIDVVFAAAAGGIAGLTIAALTFGTRARAAVRRIYNEQEKLIRDQLLCDLVCPRCAKLRPLEVRGMGVHAMPCPCGEAPRPVGRIAFPSSPSASEN